jgi:hypothetical protein
MSAPARSPSADSGRRRRAAIRALTRSRAALALVGILTAAVLLMSGPARAQTTPVPTAATADEDVWYSSLSANTYMLSEERHYVQPTLVANRGRLHLEARGNYEGLRTGSVWTGVNLAGGKRLAWELTPMLGGVFGDVAGFAPGLKGSLSWRRLELCSEGEYVVDSKNAENSFFYNWSELTVSPIDGFRFGMVTQRTHAYHSDREIQRGLIAGVSLKRLSLTSYVFNPDRDTRFVFTVELKF